MHALKKRALERKGWMQRVWFPEREVHDKMSANTSPHDQIKHFPLLFPCDIKVLNVRS